MGMSGLLSILSGLGDLLNRILNFVFGNLIRYIVVPVLSAVIEVLITVIQYFTSAIFYELSVFLLKLIDFVEVLFRALAGLKGNNANITATFSLNNGSGDLLLQFITHKDVLDVFFACAIVGIFLLLITTIFQIIRVEYTTEGANNSKTTILNKSFKSLVNMLIVPIMVVLGVFIGNQILDLIDTATGGGENARISGCLWVTSASSAMLQEPGSFTKALDDLKLDYKIDDTIDSAGSLIGLGVSLAVTEGFNAAINKIWPGKDPFISFAEKTKMGDPADRDNIESQFLKGEKHYANVLNVTTYYNPFEVNYLVLIFAGCLILKALFNCCFGMIDRLYRCTALFIVMPLAVGMAPVKDNLGSWRSSFISKALSAYGIVISMNIFFTIVQVMLKIDIQFGGDFKRLPFPNSFMVGLVKSLMVIVGCQMITKLAGDMGSYFGGGNAEADGAGLAKEATAGLQKAVAVGGGIAMGAGGLALKAAKGAGGLANKLTGGAAGRLADKVGGGIRKGADAVLGAPGKLLDLADNGIRGIGKKFNKGGRDTEEYQNYQNAAGEESTAKKNLTDKRNAYSEASNKLKELEEAGLKAGDEEYDNQVKAVNDAHDEYTTSRTDFKNASDKKNAARKAIEEGGNKKAKRALLTDDYYQEEDKKSKEKSVNRAAKRHMAGEAVRKMVGDTFNMGAVWQTMAPGALKKLPEQYQKAYTDANSVSPEGKQMLDNAAKAKADKAEADYNKRNAGWIGEKRTQQAQMIQTAMIEKVEIANEDLNKKLDKLKDAFNRAEKDDDKTYFLNQMRALNPSIQRPEADKDGYVYFTNKSQYEVKLEGLDDFKDKLAEAIKKNAKASELESMLQDQLKKWGQEGNAKLLSELHKALEEIKNTVAK